MNILPKKSWHVRTKQNIERVRRDEEKAAAEEKERQQRIAIAEQEVRTDFLRNKAGQRSLSKAAGSSSGSQIEVAQSRSHINFFSEEENSEGRSKSGGNAEHEQEKKKEKEEQERALGLLKYLGEGAAEAQTTKPWYFHAPERERKQSKEAALAREEEFDRKRKTYLDPMRSMNHYLERKEKIRRVEEDGEKKHKKHKHSKSEKKHKSNGPKSVEELRRERIAREKAEKLKAEKLLSKHRGEKSEEKETVEYDERSRRYNSQFNPELVRRHRSRHSHY